MSRFYKNTDFTTEIEELLKKFDTLIGVFDRESTEVSNERVAALQAEIMSRPTETSIAFNKLSITGAEFQTDVKAIAILRELRAELGWSLCKLQSLQKDRTVTVQAMQEHLDSIEAGNGPTLEASAGRKLH